MKTHCTRGRGGRAGGNNAWYRRYHAMLLLRGRARIWNSSSNDSPNNSYHLAKQGADGLSEWGKGSNRIILDGAGPAGATLGGRGGSPRKQDREGRGQGVKGQGGYREGKGAIGTRDEGGPGEKEGERRREYWKNKGRVMTAKRICAGRYPYWVQWSYCV